MYLASLMAAGAIVALIAGVVDALFGSDSAVLMIFGLAAPISVIMLTGILHERWMLFLGRHGRQRRGRASADG